MAQDDRNPPPGTGENLTTPGEEVAKDQTEPGHHDAEGTGKDRPAGRSSARLGTSVDPQDPVDPQSPHLPTP